MYYFLAADLAELDKQIEELLITIKRTGQEMGASTQETSETWHDNFGHEDSSRRFAMHTERYRQLTNIRRQAQVVDKCASETVVSIGSKVVLQEEDGAERAVKIGSYLTLTEAGLTSYSSPLAKLAMGAKKGDIIVGNVAGQLKVFTVLSVEPFL